jgi:hypothetical protein
MKAEGGRERVEGGSGKAEVGRRKWEGGRRKAGNHSADSDGWGKGTTKYAKGAKR